MTKKLITRDDLEALLDADGLVDIAALRAAGVTPTIQTRLVGTGVLRQLAPRLLAPEPPAWRVHVAAALRIVGSGAAYGPTALALHGIGDEELPAHVVVQRASRASDREWLRVHRSDLDRKVLTNLAPRRVGLDDSVLDALGLLDELSAIALISRVIQERRTTAARLLAVADRRRRIPHRRVVLLMLRDGAGIESALEWVYVDRVEKPHGLEPMQRQYVVPESGHRADGVFLARRWLIHLDGAAYHDPDADRRLDLRHSSMGFSSSRLTWADCWSNPCETARLLAGGVPPKRCRRCPQEPPTPR